MSDVALVGSARVHAVGDTAHVWSADDARTLRQEHRIVGSAVGCIGGLTKQAAVNGLPVVLSPEEVHLCLREGWITLQPGHQQQAGADGPASLEITMRQGTPGERCKGEHDHQGQQEQQHEKPEQQGRQGQQGQRQQQQRRQQEQEQELGRQLHAGSGAAVPTAAEQGPNVDGRTLMMPLAGTSGRPPAAAPPVWRHPCTDEERARCAVFRDLHHRGYALTGGAKFGADFLAYPGDPAMYHAQFTVRVMRRGQPLRPLQLQSWGRGAHAARKHLLLAAIDPAQLEEGEGGAGVVYVTVAPEDGFGSGRQLGPA